MIKRQIPMIFPTQLLPSALGLEWGLPSNECIELLSTAPSYLAADNAFASVPLRFDDKLQEVELFFEVAGNLDAQKWYDWRGNSYYVPQGLMWDNTGHMVGDWSRYDPRRAGLFRIETAVYAGPFVDRDQEQYIIDEETEIATAEYETEYRQLVNRCIAALGPPVFSGSPDVNLDSSTISNLISTRRMLEWPTNPDYPREEYPSESRLLYWNSNEGRLHVALRSGERDGWPVSLIVGTSRPILR